MELSNLTFKVNTEELELAADKMKELTGALRELNTANKTKSTADQSAAKAAKQLAKEQESAAKAAEQQASSTEKSAEKVDKLEKLLQKLNNQYGDLVSGFTKGEASILGQARAFGAAEAQLAPFQEALKKIKELTKDPFDASVGALRSVTAEFDKMHTRANLVAQGISLTTKQLSEYSRISAEIKGIAEKMKIDPKSAEGQAKINSMLKEAQSDYLMVAQSVNALAEAEKNLKATSNGTTSGMSDTAKAAQWLQKELARAENAVAGLNDKLRVSTSNRMFNFSEQLKKAGLDPAEAAKLMDNYSKAIRAGQDKMERDIKAQQRDLARAVSVQMGDVGISLASGMNPFTVMLQQGDQLRGAFEQSKLGAKDMEQAMVQAAGQIAQGFVVTGKAIGQFFTGTIKAAGAGMVDLTAKVFGASEAVTKMKTELALADAILGETSNKTKVFNLAQSALGLGLVGVAVALLSVVVAFVQLSNEMDKSAITMARFGGSLGMNASGAYQFAESMKSVTGNTTKTLNAVQAFAKTSTFTRSELEKIIPVALKMASAFDMPMDEVVKQFADLKKEPVDAIVKLGKETGLLTKATLDQIIAANDMGDTAKASALAIDAAAKIHGEAVNQTKLEYSALGTAVNATKKLLSGLWDEMKRGVAGVSPLQKMEDELKIAQEKAKMAKTGGFVNQYAEADVIRLQNAIAAQKELLDIEQKKKAAQSAAAEADKVAKEFNKKNEDQLRDINMKYMKRDEYVSTYMVKMKEQMKDEKAWNALSSDQIKTAEKLAGVLWDQANARKTSMGDLTDNNLSRDKAKYDSEMQTAKALGKDKLDVAAVYYKLGLVNEEKYLSDQNDLVRASEMEQLRIINEFQANLVRDRAAQTAKIRAEEAKAIGSNKANPEAQREAREAANNAITNMSQNYDNLSKSAKAAGEQIKSAADARVMKSYDELAKIIQKLNGTYESFMVNMSDNQEKRKLEAEQEKELVGTYGAQTEAIKARNASLNASRKDLISMTADLKRYEAALGDYDAQDLHDPEMLAKVQAMYAMRAKLDKANAAAKLDAENAATDAANKYYLAEWRKMQNDIADALTTALFDGSEAGAKKMKDILIAELKKPITIFVRAVVENIMGGGSGGGVANLGNMLNSAGSFFGKDSSIGSAFTSAGSWMNAGGIAGMGSAMAGGFQAAQAGMGNMAAFSGQAMGGAQGFGMQMGAGAGSSTWAGAGATTGTMVGAAAVIAAGVLAGHKLGNAVSGGYSVGSGASGNGTTNTGTAIGGIAGAVIGGPIGAAIGAAIGGPIGGVANRAFGRKTVGEGISGKFSGESFSGQKFKDEKGGWFRSDKYSTSKLDNATTQAFSSSFQAIKIGMKELTSQLGIGADAINSFTYDMKLNIMGLSNEDAAKKITEEFDKMTEAMAKAALGTDEYNRVGETYTQALQRISATLTGVNAIFKDLGFVLFKTSLSGYGAAEAFLNLLGGLDKAVPMLETYYSTFFTEEEKKAKLTAKLADQFKQLGVAMPTDRLAYRVAIEKAMADGNTKLAAEMIKLSASFAEITPVVEGLAGKFGKLFGALATETITAIDKQIEASRNAGNAAADAAKKYKDLANSLREASAKLTTEGMNPNDTAASLKATMQATFQAALGGDTKALGNLSGQSTDFINAYKEVAVSKADFIKQTALVKNQLDQAAAVADTLGVGADYQAKLYEVNTAMLEVLKADLQNNNLTQDRLKEQLAALNNISNLIKDSNSLTVSVAADSNGVMRGALIDNSGRVVAGLDSATVEQIRSAYKASDVLLAGFKNETTGQTTKLGSLSEAQLDQLKAAKDLQATSLTINDIVAKATAGSATLLDAVLAQLKSPDAGAIYLSANFKIGTDLILASLQKLIDLSSPKPVVPPPDVGVPPPTPTPGPWAGGYIPYPSFGYPGSNGGDGRPGTDRIPKPIGYANGGVFTNGIVSNPTSFHNSEMGEAGPEAIMPLSRMSNGGLGVVSNSGNSDALVNELQALRNEVVMLRAETRAVVTSTSKTAKILDRSSEQDVLKVQIVAV